MIQRFVVGICVLLPALALAQPVVNDFVVDDAKRERLVSDVIHELEQKFVFPERVAKKLPSLIGHWSSPPFSTLTSASEIVRAINADLTDAFHDGHLMLLPGRAEDLPAAM